MPDHNYFSNLIWQIADLLRGPYRPPQYERVMLPMTVLRRFDCVLAPTKPAVLRKYDQVRDKLKGEALDAALNKAAGQRFHNHSGLDFQKLKGDPDQIHQHLAGYIKSFSANVRRIFDFFEFDAEIAKMRDAGILYLVVSKFAEIDLHPDNVPNQQMGLIFENLIRRFNELANETAGDHFTPREVIRLMVNILFIKDDHLLSTPGTVRQLLDPACGTGGMLAEAQNYLRDHHPAARLYVYGQDYNPRAYATAASDMLIKQVDHNGGGDNVRFGDSFTDDQFAGMTFDYFLTNPPFGVDWKKQQKEIEKERNTRGFDGRFGAGLPRVNDGALLFLQHMIHKFEPVRPAEQKHGSRLAVVFSGSPLFTGGAGSGESEIRRWIIENDWLEAIIALPEQMFYNTGIGTYVWIVTNRKEKRRKGKIQLIDAREMWTAGGSEENRRSLGDKRRHMTAAQIRDVVKIYGRFEEGEVSKIFPDTAFGYTRVTVERPLRLNFQAGAERIARLHEESAFKKLPESKKKGAAAAKEMAAGQALQESILKMLGSINPQEIYRSRPEFTDVLDEAIEDSRRIFNGPVRIDATLRKAILSALSERDESAEVCVDGKGRVESDPELRDFENVPLEEDINAYFDREVRPHVPDAWMDRTKDKVGYEINFNRHFYRYMPPRPLEEIDAALRKAEEEIVRLLREMTT
ncbi:MAG TPA: class I SAM-dependent DNA methyltransferase [Thermoanaerobaculia bacterium]|nr:class I SAM-dependent DNA methyltransferase [Thermoanaerobaculia bacterium]